MAVKFKSASRTKSVTKKKLTVKTKKQLNSKQNDFSHLSKEIISNVGVGWNMTLPSVNGQSKN